MKGMIVCTHYGVLTLGIWLCGFSVSLLAQNTSVQGVVTRSGSIDPLSKALVELRTDDNNSSILNNITTEDDGKFLFQNVRPGRYRLTVKRAGYVRPPITITVPASTIQLAMTPAAAISGRVYDNKGQPFGNLLVQALKATFPEGRRVLTPVQSVQTNDLGEYRLFWLQPGRYYVAAIHPQVEASNFTMLRFGGASFSISSGIGGNAFFFSSSGNTDPAIFPETMIDPLDLESADRYAPIYFPGTVDEAAATAIEVRAGADFDGVNIVVAPVRERHIRGMILDGRTGKAPEYSAPWMACGHEQNHKSIRIQAHLIPCSCPALMYSPPAPLGELDMP